jgi:hypothetical protein
MSKPKPLFSNEIDCLVRRILSVRDRVHWLGVFARDKLPDLSRQARPFALVFNSDPQDKPGQHWLAIYGPESGPIELFDSFGLSPHNYSLDPLRILYHSCSFQSSFSVVCGHYCIVFLYYRSLGITFHDFIELLKSQANDQLDSFIAVTLVNLKHMFNLLYPCTRTGQCSKAKCSFC